MYCICRIEKDKERFVEFTIRGNVDDIVSDRHPMNFQQIAKVGDGSWPKLILVEGAPGVGKSTFAWKVCRKWNKGTILNQYKLVILLRLRDKHVREAKTLYDLIYYHDPEEWKLIVKEILKSNGKEALLLFEGYDELPAQLQRDEESILLKVISGNCLPEATVLVTSRHSASGLLLEKYKKRIVNSFSRFNSSSTLSLLSFSICNPSFNCLISCCKLPREIWEGWVGLSGRV